MAEAAEAAAEADAIVETTGTRLAPYAAMMVAALQGRDDGGLRVLDSAIEEAAAVGQGFAVQWGAFSKAILFNGLGRYGEALAAARQAAEEMPELLVSSWALAEVIEAASRSGCRLTPPARSSGSRRSPRSPAPTGDSGSRRVRKHC